MGQVRDTAPPVTMIVAGFSADQELMDTAVQVLSDKLGAVSLTGPRVEFTETSYYAKSMGARLFKQLWAFEPLQPADKLPEIKRWTNELEVQLAPGDSSVERPLNLDPGYVDSGKFVLASTKDHAHRIYMHEGIFAEVTLYLRSGAWQKWPWTYPDYQREDVQSFLLKVREFHRQKLKQLSQ